MVLHRHTRITDYLIHDPKNILKILGQNPALLPLLEQAWETWKPDYEKGGIPTNLLSAALAASVVIVVAASEVKGTVGGVEFHKYPVPIQAVTELVGQFGQFVPGLINK